MAAEGRVCSAVVRLVEGTWWPELDVGTCGWDLCPGLEARPCGQNWGLETCGRDLWPELETGTCGQNLRLEICDRDLWPELEA